MPVPGVFRSTGAKAQGLHGGRRGVWCRGWNVAVSRVSSHICEAGNKLRWGVGGGCVDRDCRRLCPRRSPAAHRGALQRGDPPFVRTVTQPAPSCPAVPTGIPRTHAWPHARPRTLTSRSRPCLFWTPLRTGRGGRGAGGRAYAEHTPPWRWELKVELWPAAASQTTGPGARLRRSTQWSAAWRAWSCAAPPAFPG